LLAERHFSLSKFLLAMSLSASWQIAYGPYVADYSRYLPRDTSVARVFTAVGLGSVIGSQISMTFGVLAAALAGTQFEHHEVAYIVSLGSTGAVAGLLYFSIAFGKVTVTSLNAYGSFMSMATIVSGFRRGLRISVWHRFFYIVSMVGVSALLALTGRHSFLKAFEAFILCLLAVFTPWSAINLIDYYCFTRSRYDVPALSDPDGRYGRYGRRQLSSGLEYLRDRGGPWPARCHRWCRLHGDGEVDSIGSIRWPPWSWRHDESWWYQRWQH
jgi:NCS1 family nucleobase:cation symporter-1